MIIKDTPFNPNVPHCGEERRIRDAMGNDGGGHSQCLTELRADGSCPRVEEHHSVYIARLRKEDEENAAVMGISVAQWRTHQAMMEQGTTPTS